MALNRWSPMGELAGLHSAMDRLFGDFFGGPVVESGGQMPPQTWYLPIDVIDQAEGYEVKAPVPGFNPEDVEVTFMDGVLTITAQHSEESTSQSGTYLRREMKFGNFVRSIQLPAEIKQGEIKASFDNGVLTVQIPKVPKPQPVKIQVTGKRQNQLVGVNTQK